MNLKECNKIAREKLIQYPTSLRELLKSPAYKDSGTSEMVIVDCGLEPRGIAKRKQTNIPSSFHHDDRQYTDIVTGQLRDSFLVVGDNDDRNGE